MSDIEKGERKEALKISAHSGTRSPPDTSVKVYL
jgi:hypothetical protein